MYIFSPKKLVHLDLGALLYCRQNLSPRKQTIQQWEWLSDFTQYFMFPTTWEMKKVH